MEAYGQSTGVRLTCETISEDTRTSVATLQSVARPSYNTRLSIIESCAGGSNAHPVTCSSLGMMDMRLRMKISRAAATTVLHEEALQAEKGPVDADWEAKLKHFSKLRADGVSKTHIAFLRTAIHAKSNNRDAYPYAIKPTHSQGNEKGFLRTHAVPQRPRASGGGAGHQSGRDRPRAAQ